MVFEWLVLLLILGVPIFLDPTRADPIADGLMDPDTQPKFVEAVPEALSPSFKIILPTGQVTQIGVYSILHETGLVDFLTGERLTTPVFGYGTRKDTASWPGPTLEARMNVPASVRWVNKLFDVTSHPFTSLVGEQSVVDTSIHWAYSLEGYRKYSIEEDGIPIVVHLHGSHSGPDLDGNPEHFFSPGFHVRGPEWTFKTYEYPNDQPAGALWYHDHTLGITRLNVYSGLAGFYFVRDDEDNGKVTNTLGLPSGEYEKAYAIQDRMFKANGELFYPAFEGEPGYADYITAEGANWDPSQPTALAEFFGDFMIVNGKIWPQQTVANSRYRLRLLNGCDSRFLAVSFIAVEAGATSIEDGTVVPFTLVGADQGLLDAPIRGVTRSLIELGARLDIVINFERYYEQRIIMVNEGGDSPFSGELPGEQLYNYTSMIMAFDVTNWSEQNLPKPDWDWVKWNSGPATAIRRVGLFEGKDSYGRLQPLQGGEIRRNVIETLTWSDPTTETPEFGATEEWEIYNFSPDAHPVHLHLVDFRVIRRHNIIFDSQADADTRSCQPGRGAWDGVCLKSKPMVQHDGSIGEGFQALLPDDLQFAYEFEEVILGDDFLSENGGLKDVVAALPGQVTVIQATFSKRGKYVWHCHILSHEDHEMMRRFEVI